MHGDNSKHTEHERSLEVNAKRSEHAQKLNEEMGSEMCNGAETMDIGAELKGQAVQLLASICIPELEKAVANRQLLESNDVHEVQDAKHQHIHIHIHGRRIDTNRTKHSMVLLVRRKRKENPQGAGNY